MRGGRREREVACSYYAVYKTSFFLKVTALAAVFVCFTHFIGLAAGLLPVSQLGLAAQQTTLQGLEFVSMQLHQPAQFSGWTPRYRRYSNPSNPMQVQAHTALLGLFGWIDMWQMKGQ